MRPVAAASVAALALALPLAGCSATPRTVLVDGREVPRPTLTFRGQPFTIHHARAFPNPGSPSGGLRDLGGDISGRVCGLDVDYEVRHDGDRVELAGHIDGPLPARLEVREDGEARTFSGELGGARVLLALRADGLSGSVGRRELSLSRVGDDLGGVMTVEGGGTAAVVLHGLQALGDMPPADQAAVLPSLLTCALVPGRGGAQPTLEVGIGGAVTEAQPQTSSLYTRSR